jgi:branched-chain amino acid transport system ATP-binding protein
MLGLENIYSGYGQVNIIDDVSLEVKEREIVSIIGANGAGKSTLLKTISGLVRQTSGKIFLAGSDISHLPPHKRIDRGISQVPEGRQVIAELTVRENLILGCYLKYDKLGGSGRQRLINNVHALFPILAKRMNQMAGTLSGGEQQMLSISRALMGEPNLLLLDEPSQGLAPLIVHGVLKVLVELNKNEGLTILMVEQNAVIALEVSNRAYVLEVGRISLQGKGTDLIQDDNVRKSYLGI